MWRPFQRKLSKQGRSASQFLREKIWEFLQEEMPIESPLARYHRAYCNGCPCSDACKNDKTIEIRCYLAFLALSPTRLTAKDNFG